MELLLIILFNNTSVVAYNALQIVVNLQFFIVAATVFVLCLFFTENICFINSFQFLSKNLFLTPSCAYPHALLWHFAQADQVFDLE